MQGSLEGEDFKLLLEMHHHLLVLEREEATGWHRLLLDMNCSGRRLPVKRFFFR